MILLGRESAEQKVVTQFGMYDARKVCIELKKAADSVLLKIGECKVVIAKPSFSLKLPFDL